MAGCHARMSSWVTGKGAYARAYGQVTNIRLRPSPREERRGDAGSEPHVAPLTGGDINGSIDT